MKFKLEKIWDFLNRDVSKLFKREYDYKYFRREDKGKGVFELKKYDKTTGEEVQYDSSIYLQTTPRDILTPKNAWFAYPEVV